MGHMIAYRSYDLSSFPVVMSMKGTLSFLATSLTNASESDVTTALTPELLSISLNQVADA